MQLYGGSNHVPLHQVSGFYGKVIVPHCIFIPSYLISCLHSRVQMITLLYWHAYILCLITKRSVRLKWCHPVRSSDLILCVQSPWVSGCALYIYNKNISPFRYRMVVRLCTISTVKGKTNISGFYKMVFCILESQTRYALLLNVSLAKYCFWMQ